MTLIPNLAGRRDAPWTTAQDAILSDRGLRVAHNMIASWEGYAPTPLVALPGLAAEAGVAEIHLKDEGGRFGLGSFKALGGAFAVARVLARELGASRPDLAACAQITVTCATDGNHGRSVAWGAERFGCRAVIYIHQAVSKGREVAIARFGADVRRVRGDYDDSVRFAAREAASNGWHVVSDTSWPGYTDVPGDVMQGYEVMAKEAFEALDAPPTHIFLQTGVGGMAAAVTATAKRRWGDARPVIILADPQGAACWAESFIANAPTPAKGAVETAQAGLACGEVSELAWTILRDHADAAILVPDGAAFEMMRRLARPTQGDAPIVAGESAVAGLAACLDAEHATRTALKLGKDARVLVFSTEGDTDPELYRQIVGADGRTIPNGGVHAT